MSRHRNLRKVSLGDDDYDDDIAQSYDDKYYAISPGTSEMYMFNRSGDQQNMSQFMKGKILEEEDYDNNESNNSESQASRNQETKNEGIQSNLLKETQSQKNKPDEDFMFLMDKEPNSQLQQQEIQAKKSKAPKLQTKSKEVQKPQEKIKNTFSTPNTKQPISTTSKQFDKSSTQIPSINELKINASASSDNIKKFVVDKEQLLKQYEEHTAGKDVINLIVIGHVDAGKSTLMGHLLFQLGQVSGKLMHKYKQESQKIGKGSFAYAWILDETEEERTRGVTIDIAQTKFETEKKVVNLMDAPGHKDFIPNMITGASHADSAILVINSITGEFETGFQGQTREHALLVKSLGVTQLVVAVNKMDMYDWSKERFEFICKKLNTFLVKQVGFKENDLMFVPLSGLVGDNLTTKATNEKLTNWYNESLIVEGVNIIGGLTLLDCINRFRPYERPIDKPLRFCISDVYKSLQTAAISLAGKMETGSVKCGDRICIMPSNEIGQVKTITNNDEQSLQTCFAGDSVIINVSNVDMNNISIGNFVCDCISPPMLVSDKLRAKIVLFNLEMPLIKGFSVVFHYKSMSESAVIKKLISQLDKNTGDVVKEKPRFLTKGMSAMIEIKINRPICMELYQNYRELGRFMLRLSDTTIAAGLITEIIQ